LENLVWSAFDIIQVVRFPFCIEQAQKIMYYTDQSKSQGATRSAAVFVWSFMRNPANIPMDYIAHDTARLVLVLALYGHVPYSTTKTRELLHVRTCVWDLFYTQCGLQYPESRITATGKCYLYNIL
jgi:hypothetical protein